jgi:curli biogenesis system outer membrane secretion channel CsgG
MHKSFLLFISGLLVLSLSCTSYRTSVKYPDRIHQIKTVAILPFTSNEKESGSAIAEAIGTCMLNSNFSILERAELVKILTEKSLSLSGVVEGNQAFLGKLTGVDAVVLGSVTISRGFAGLLSGGYIDFVSNCSARLVDVATGDILISTSYSSHKARNLSGVSTLQAAAEKMCTGLNVK